MCLEFVRFYTYYLKRPQYEWCTCGEVDVDADAAMLARPPLTRLLSILASTSVESEFSRNSGTKNSDNVVFLEYTCSLELKISIASGSVGRS